MRKQQILGAAGSVFLGAIACEGAMAQGAVALEEIVVTARFREESLQETPLAITAVTGEALEDRNIVNLQDLGRAVPNAFIAPGTAAVGATPAIALRGVFQSDFNFAFEPGVGVYIDDVYHSTLMGSAMDLMDIERIEVLRGPQGTLFGKNTLGGAIRLQSKKPEGDNSGSIEVGYGKYHRQELKGSFDTALLPDRVFMRVAGVSKSYDGYQTIRDFTCDMYRKGTPELAGYGDGLGAGGVAVPVGSPADLEAALPSALINAGSIESMAAAANGQSCGLGRTGGQDLNAGRIMFRVLANDKLEINIAADYTDDHRDVNPDSLIEIINPILSSPTAPPDFFFSFVRDQLLQDHGFVYDQRFIPDSPFVTYASNRDLTTGRSQPNTASVQAWGVQTQFDYEINDDMRAKLILASREYESQFSHDADVSPLGFGLNGNDITHRQYTGELQLQGQALDGKLDWTVGGYYLDGKSHMGGAIDYVVLHFLQNDTFKDESESAFAHFVMHPTDRLSLTAGVRFSKNEKEFTFDHINSGFPVLTQSATTRQTDWTLSADYKLTDDILVYTTASTGFRPRSINPRPLTPNQFAPIPGEELTSYEVGVKGEYFDNRLLLNLAGFYSDYESHLRQLNGFECAGSDLPVVFDPAQCPVGTSPVTWFYYVGEEAEIKGLEAEFTLAITDSFSIDGAVGINDFSSSGTGVAHFDSSNRIQPDTNASLGAQYMKDLLGGTFVARFDWRYLSEMTYNPAPTMPTNSLFNVPSHTVMDARVAYEFGGGDWEAALSVTNVADKFYYNNKFSLTGFNVSGGPAQPRAWRLSIKRNF